MKTKIKPDVWTRLLELYEYMTADELMLRVDSIYEGAGNFFVGVFGVQMWGFEFGEKPVIVGTGYWIDYTTNAQTYRGKATSSICYEVYDFFTHTDQFQVLDFVSDGIRYRDRIDNPKQRIQYRLF